MWGMRVFYHMAGWIAIAFGIWWAVSPGALRGMLVRRVGWKLSCLFLAFFFLPLLKIGLAAGILGILAVFVLLVAGLSLAAVALLTLLSPSVRDLQRADAAVGVPAPAPAT